MFRSIGIDEENKVLVGNGTTTASKAKGKKKVIVVNTDGETLVAVRRSGLSDEQKKKVIIADNRTGESSSWNPEVLIGMMNEFENTNNTGWHTEEFEHYKNNHDYDEGDFNHLFGDENENIHRSNNKINIKLSYSEAEGNQVIEKLKAINPDLSKAVLELLKK